VVVVKQGYRKRQTGLDQLYFVIDFAQGDLAIYNSLNGKVQRIQSPSMLPYDRSQRAPNQ
jgi:hypothetical protein